MTVTINGTEGVTLDNGSADGAQVSLASSGYSNWNLDNYSGRLRAYYGASEKFTIDTSGNVGISTGNLNFSGSAQRITGDFSNATIANRVMFQTSTANATTAISAIPSGTGVASQYATYSNSDPTNASVGIFANNNATVNLQSSITGTGTYLPMALFTGGSERMRIDTSGNVGIGTSSPSQRLDVQAPTALSKLTSTTGTNACFYWANNTGGNFYIGNDNSVGGSFGIAYGRVLYSDGAYPMAFFTNSAERMRIDSSGNLLVGTTSTPSASVKGFAVIPTASTCIGRWATNTTSADALLDFYNPNGKIGQISVSGSATSFTSLSDYRLKENVHPMTGALSKVAALKPVTYKWKTDGSDGQGFIAHELQAVVPECVTGEKDAVDSEGNPVYQGIDTSFLVATLTAAIQELKAELDVAKADIAALRATPEK